MRLPEIHILCRLAAAYPQPLYATEMVDKSMGILKRGSVYIDLASLEDMGLIRRDLDDLDFGELRPPRSLFRLTRKGAALFTGEGY